VEIIVKPTKPILIIKGEGNINIINLISKMLKVVYTKIGLSQLGDPFITFNKSIPQTLVLIENPTHHNLETRDPPQKQLLYLMYLKYLSNNIFNFNSDPSGWVV
jgi:hypothetical protein